MSVNVTRLPGESVEISVLPSVLAAVISATVTADGSAEFSNTGKVDSR